MSPAGFDRSSRLAIHRSAAILKAADGLTLAASPTFAIMALVTAMSDESAMLCSVTPDLSPIHGMALMYLLMSVFHAAPWLKLIAGRPGVAGRR